MCGIFGLIAPALSADEVRRASDRLAHRGPDDAGVYVGQGAALATRRLSIVDIEGGHQPLANEDGGLWVTYNGEIFNAPLLRAELEAAGHRFKTRADTEVIVHAFEQWGAESVERLHGMFAFGVWDARRGRLVLARDRFGIKPLYYARSGDRFAFASEIRPLLEALPDLPRRANPEALWRLFERGFIPSPLTAFEGVRKLPAAHILVVENGRLRLQPYWRLEFPARGARRRIAPAAAAEAFLDRLRDTVDAWRLSDVPVGALLSGGVDSASLAALLTEAGGGPIHTFHVGFEAASHDESAQARETARFLGSEHHTLTFTAADFDRLPDIMRRLEEPQCSATSVPIYLLYSACHEAGFKVIMTGEGADELLGGYHWFDGDRRARRWLRLPRPLRAALAGAPARMSEGARRVLRSGETDPVRRYALWHQVGNPRQLAALLRTPAPAADEAGDGVLPKNRHPFDQFVWLDASARLVDFINFEVDRMSMASSVEARPPFLDHALWEFCAELPPECKLSARGNKLLLRDGMRGRLPEVILRQPKRGLATPHARWWRADRLPAWAEDCLHPSALAELAYFEPGEVGRLRADHRAGRVDASRLLMGVLTMQLWHAEFVG